MVAMERLPWKKARPDKFVAHPEGEGTEPSAHVWLDQTRPRGSNWLWSVRLAKWFNANGNAADAAAASAAATQAWHTLKQTPIPRDVAGEIAAIMAVIETEPLRDDLLSDDYAFLLGLMNEIRIKYIGTMQYPPPPPDQVRKVMAELSAEFHRRRTAATESNQKPAG
jgi:hypothetical protein